MDYVDNFHPNEANAIEKDIEDIKQFDKGYCKIYREKPNRKGIIKNTGVDVYVSGSTGSKIRDAESGYYYNELIGSLGEDRFFKVSLSTGELKSKNGNNTLFYISPRSYENHMNTTVNPEILLKWDQRQII